MLSQSDKAWHTQTDWKDLFASFILKYFSHAVQQQTVGADPSFWAQSCYELCGTLKQVGEVEVK